MPFRLRPRFAQQSYSLCANAPLSDARFMTSKRWYSTPTSSASKVIFSGIQPTGVPHLGNYLGALQQWVKLQHDAPPDTQLIYSIVDLHAITIYQNPDYLRKCKTEMLATLLAIGLDPKLSTIFYQSSVHQPSLKLHHFPTNIARDRSLPILS